MIQLYSGTPGSGKSLHAAKEMIWAAQHKKFIICNFEINEQEKNLAKAKIISMDNSQISAQWLVDFAMKNHEPGKEYQSLLVLDECQLLLNTRLFNQKDRMAWISFFSQHRKLGFDVICISQNDRMIDRQIRVMFEYEVMHRKLSQAGSGGLWLRLLTGGEKFLAITTWYGGNKEVLEKTFYMYTKRLGNFYNSYSMFNSDDAQIKLNKELSAKWEKRENNINKSDSEKDMDAAEKRYIRNGVIIGGGKRYKIIAAYPVEDNFVFVTELQEKKRKP